MISERNMAIAGDGVQVHGYEITCMSEGCGAKVFMPVRKSMPAEWVPKHFAQKGWEIQNDGTTTCAKCVKHRIGRPPTSKIAHHGTQVLQAIMGLPLNDKNFEKIARNIGLPVDGVAQLVTKKHHRKYRLTMLPHATVSTPILERALKELSMTFDVMFHSSVLSVSVTAVADNNQVFVRAAMVWVVTMDKRG